MTHSVRKFAALGLLAALNACTYWHGDFERLADQSGRNFRIDPERNYKHVELSSVQANPSSYKLTDIQFYAILNRKDEKIFVTYYSTFRQEDYMSFSAWPIETPIWEAEHWVKSIPTLYMRKDNQGLQHVIDSERYALVHIKGRVMNDFEQLPFIDVEYFEVVDPVAYTEETLTDLRGAMAAIAEKKPAQSIELLERALDGALHGRGRATARLHLGRLYEERGNFDKAAANFEAVLWDDPNNIEAWEGWDRNTKAAERKRAMPEEPAPAPPPAPPKE